MLNVSNQFKNELYNDNRDYLCYADITLADGGVLNLEDEDIWTDSFSIEDAVSGTGSFDIGEAIINKLTLSINNIYETYSMYDFTDAVVIPYVGLTLPDGTVEKIRKGVFTVDEASYDGSLITLSCLDNMYKLDYSYAESSLSYPATLGEIVRDVCYVCGVTLQTTTFFNSSYVVQNRPADESLTCRQVLSWAAQIACSWVRFDTYGRLRLDWYDQSVFENHTALNGGIFDKGNPYASGDIASGGTFRPWTDGDCLDGGTFKELSAYHHIYSMSSMNLCTDDVVITGLKVTESFEETDTDKVQSYLFGSEGYLISLEGNDLIQKGSAEAVARAVGGKVVGMRFRPFDVSALNDPSIEAGDPVIVTDRKQRSYQSYITSTTFKAGNYQQVRCSAETPSRNSAQRFSDTTRNIVKTRREASRKISDYDKAMQMLTSLITQSFGVFKTEEKLDDGSTIFYLHNKPTLNESMTVWKMTADAFAVTTDGGKTWNAGMDSEGNLVVNVLSAIGINAEWINTGELVVRDHDGNVTFLANVDTGRVVINAQSVAISGKAASTQEYANAVVANQTQSDIFNKLTNNGKTMGIYLQNGVLYINASYINTGFFSFDRGHGGTLTLGGSNNENGQIIMLDAEGNEIGRWTKDGLFATKGKFLGDLEGATGTYSGDLVVNNALGSRYPVRIVNESAGSYVGVGGRGLLIAYNKRYIRVEHGITTGRYPILEGGSYTGIDKDTLELTGAKMQTQIDADGVFESKWIAGNTNTTDANVHINSSGRLYKTSSSSRRYKTDESMELGELDPKKLYRAPVKSFKYADGYLTEGDPGIGKTMIGFIVEDLEEIYPYAVTYENGKPEMWNVKMLVPPMLKLIQDQHGEIEALKSRVSRLEKILEEKEAGGKESWLL